MSENTTPKYEIATHAALPPLLLLLIEMALNHYAAPANAIFISPYLLSCLVVCVVGLVVLWKGQICPGQEGRLTFVFPFLLIFALGNFLYTLGFTPRHSPMYIVAMVSIIVPLLFLWLPKEETLYRTMIYCGLGISAIGIVQYLVIYWIELPALFNGIRANNFAQLLLGLLLAGWYLMLAKSRLEIFLKLLVKLALLVLVLNYLWIAFVLWQQWQLMPEMSVNLYLVSFGVQFAILAILAWLLLSRREKAIKNPLAWSVVTLLAMLYPFTNIA